MKKTFFSIFIAVLGLAFIGGSSTVSRAADFYKGKTIRFIVGYDTYTRAIARCIGKYIPGHPAASQIFFVFSFAAFLLWILAGSTSAQTSTENPPQIIRGTTEQGLAYMTGGVGTDEREIMQSWGRDYNLKLAFAEMLGVYLSDVELWIEKDGREMVHATANGPWFYIKLPPGRYTVKATYEGETKQIKNLQVTEGDRVTRILHWDLKEES